MLLTWGQGSGLRNTGVIFNLPLADAGAGIVNTTPSVAAGSSTPTFTRASVAWTKLSTGLWAQIASGQPRSCYLGATTAVGAYGGYLSEQAVAQLVTPTASIRDMTNAAWSAVNVTPVKDATGIDGVVNSATTLTSGAIGGSILQTLVAAGSSRTYSVWLRRKTGTGTITISQGATTLDVTASLNSTTYTRVELNANVLNAAFGITFGASGDAVEADFNQFEGGPVATSPIASAETGRAFDSLSYPVAGNILSATGTCLNDAAFTTAATTSGVSVGGFTQNFQLNRINSTVQSLMFDGTNAVTKSGLTFTAQVVAKMGCTWGALGQRLTAGGVAPGSGAFDGDMTNSDTAFGIGFAVGAAADQCTKNVVIYSVQMTDSQLQAATT